MVFGAGMVGLGAVAGCRLQGAERIICVDLSEDRLELARGQGAIECWLADEHTVERVLETTGGFGADYTFEATGLVSVMRQAVEAAKGECWEQFAGRHGDNGRDVFLWLARRHSGKTLAQLGAAASGMSSSAASEAVRRTQRRLTQDSSLAELILKTRQILNVEM